MVNMAIQFLEGGFEHTVLSFRYHPESQALQESVLETGIALTTGKYSNSPLKICKKLNRDLITSYRNCFDNPGEHEGIF